jgi:hypothetical protein
VIQVCVGEKNRVECAIRRRRRPVQRLGFFAALKQTAIEKNSGLLSLDEITGTGDFSASGANERDFHRDW